jgi:hypothetical protein
MRLNKCVPILDIDPIMVRATSTDFRASFRIRHFPGIGPVTQIRAAWFFMRAGHFFPIAGDVSGCRENLADENPKARNFVAMSIFHFFRKVDAL